MPNYRGGRINEEVRKEISHLLQYEVKDPRLTAMVSVTDVKVTKDLKYAKIYVSLFSKNNEEKEESFEAIKNAAGFMRRELGRRINLRYTPELIFEIDNSIDRGMHIDSILNKIKEK